MRPGLSTGGPVSGHTGPMAQGPIEARPAPGAEIVVDSRHWDGSDHRSFTGVALGADEWGFWVGVPAGTWITTIRGGFASAGGVRLFPVGRWWSAWFSPGRLYVDITTPPKWSGSTVLIVDLDLDVESEGGDLVLRDEDEFDDRRESMGYPTAVVDAARAAAEEVLELASTGAEPFHRAFVPWLAQITGF